MWSVYEHAADQVEAKHLLLELAISIAKPECFRRFGLVRNQAAGAGITGGQTRNIPVPQIECPARGVNTRQERHREKGEGLRVIQRHPHYFSAIFYEQIPRAHQRNVGQHPVTCQAFGAVETPDQRAINTVACRSVPMYQTV